MAHYYLCLNGTGVLGLDVECMFHSPITGLDYEISHFISFKYGGAQFTIDGGASIARIEENRASNLLVFAIAEDHSPIISIITCLFAPQTFNRKWWIAIFILFQVK